MQMIPKTHQGHKQSMDIIELFNGNIPAKNGKVTDGVMKVLYSMQSNVFLLGGESRSKEGIVEFLGLVDISFFTLFSEAMFGW
jgi:hypothetical protein